MPTVPVNFKLIDLFIYCHRTVELALNYLAS